MVIFTSCRINYWLNHFGFIARVVYVEAKLEGVEEVEGVQSFADPPGCQVHGILQGRTGALVDDQC